jgi:hypothetical protein
MRRQQLVFEGGTAMKKGIWIFGATIVLALALLTGCSKDSEVTVPTDEQGLNYEEEFGGYTATDEAPGFGDETISDDMQDNVVTEMEEPEFSPVFDSLDSVEDVRVYRMTILWGMLEYDSTVTQSTDWSGSLTVERGAIRILSLVRFEQPFDHIIRPRIDRRTLEWVSHTQPHFDGIVVWLYDVPDSEGIYDNTVTFKTGPYTRTFDMSELESLSEVVVVDEIGNKVSFEALYLPVPDCPYGFLEGRWIKKGPENGVFYGFWANWSGMHDGHVRGHWGATNTGDRVFFGKWIDHRGKFRGFLKGTWDFNATTAQAEPVTGTFEGIWADRHRTPQGTLGGNWVAVVNPPGNNGNGNGWGNTGDEADSGNVGSIPKRARGFFQGHWTKDCPED